MTDRVVVLDVGHGNCTIVHDGADITVIDAAKAKLVLEHLHGRRQIKAVLVSHGDKDHLAGAGALLTHHAVEAVYVNPDPKRRTREWEEFLTAIKIARHERGTAVHPSLTTDSPGLIVGASFTLEVVAPTPEVALRGSGGRGQTANTVSAVVRITKGGIGRVLLAADMDDKTLDSILAEPSPPDISADVLVFPHHGGLPGAARPRPFARRLVGLVQPDRIVFSAGRHDNPSNPHPEIVEGVREGAPEAHVLCTQLSRDCRSHPADLPHGDRCAGTIEVHIDRDESVVPIVDDHLKFIRDHARTPLCQGK